MPRALTLALLLAAAPAAAQPSSPAVHCQLGVTPLDFGSYSARRPAPTDFTATLTVFCHTPLAAPTPVSGSIAPADGPSLTRRLAQPKGALAYQLFQDPAHRIPWAANSAIPLRGIVARGHPLRLSVTVYGRLLARQGSAPVGQYADHLVAVLSY